MTPLSGNSIFSLKNPKDINFSLRPLPACPRLRRKASKARLSYCLCLLLLPSAFCLLLLLLPTATAVDCHCYCLLLLPLFLHLSFPVTATAYCYCHCLSYLAINRTVKSVTAMEVPAMSRAVWTWLLISLSDPLRSVF